MKTRTLGGSISQAQNIAHRNPWVLGLGGLVAVVLAVNAYMIYLAFATSPGLVSSNYYEQGRQYEKTLVKRLAERTALGWELNLDVPETIVQTRPVRFRLAVVDAQGLPLVGQVKVFAYRPSDAAADFSLPMQEDGPGRYRADLTFPLKGIWDLIIHVERDHGDADLARRISVVGS